MDFTQALILGQGKKINIYTDSKYTFLVLHAHVAIWRERGLLTTRDAPIKHGPEIPNVLEAVKLPEQVAVMHCKGPQKDTSPISQGNRRQTKRQRR